MVVRHTRFPDCQFRVLEQSSQDFYITDVPDDVTRCALRKTDFEIIERGGALVREGVMA